MNQSPLNPSVLKYWIGHFLTAKRSKMLDCDVYLKHILISFYRRQLAGLQNSKFCITKVQIVKKVYCHLKCDMYFL